MEPPSLGQRWRSVAVPMAFLRLGGQALEFLGWIIFARKLGTSGYGTLAVAFLVARYLAGAQSLMPPNGHRHPCHRGHR